MYISRKLSTEELMLLNCGVEGDSWEPLDCKEIKLVNPKRNLSWIFIGRSDTDIEIQYYGHLMWRTDTSKDLDAGKDWMQEEKGTTEDEMVTWHHWWTWIWASSGNWRWTGKPGMLQSTGSQRVGHSWMTELNWTDKNTVLHLKFVKCNWIKFFSITKPFYGNENSEGS